MHQPSSPTPHCQSYIDYRPSVLPLIDADSRADSQLSVFIYQTTTTHLCSPSEPEVSIKCPHHLSLFNRATVCRIYLFFHVRLSLHVDSAVIAFGSWFSASFSSSAACCHIIDTFIPVDTSFYLFTAAVRHPDRYS